MGLRVFVTDPCVKEDARCTKKRIHWCGIVVPAVIFGAAVLRRERSRPTNNRNCGLGSAGARCLEALLDGRAEAVARKNPMVQLSKVRELIKAWEAKGNPPCDHPKTDREYYLGAHTGDDACLVCGASWPSGQKPPPESQG